MVDIVLETILFIRLVYRYVAGATTSDSGSPLNLRREIRDVDDISALKHVQLGSLTLRNKVRAVNDGRCGSSWLGQVI